MRDKYQHGSYTVNHYGLMVHNQAAQPKKIYLRGNVSMNFLNAKFK